MKKNKQDTPIVEEDITLNEEQAEEQSNCECDTTDEEQAEEAEADECEALKQRLAEANDKYLRLAAEFDNFRKRTLKEKADLILNGGEKVLVSILPVIDNLERALSTMETASADIKPVKEGVELIHQQILKVLATHGVSQMEPIGEPLNTDYHEAIAMLPAADEEAKGKIIDCVEKGYTMGEKVIRHAKVAVAQ